VRGLLGCGAACAAELLTYTVMPFRAFPVLLAFPAIVLSFWFLGISGGVFCALSEAILVNSILSRTHMGFPNTNVPESLRLFVFFFFSIIFGWAFRQLGQQRTQLRTQELQQRLILVQGERRLAEERAGVSEALRERDEMLKIALEVNGMGLWVWDVVDGTVYGSDAVMRMTGRRPASTYQASEEWLRLVHPEDTESIKRAMAETRSSGKDYRQQYRIVLPDGSLRWMETQGKCQRNSESQVTRVVGVMADITHRKLTEEAMLRTEKLAVAGRLAASVAHEINNPLEAVSNLLYLISTAESAEAARSHASQALDELMRVSLITQQTLKFHRQLGAPAITRLSEVVAGVLALFRGRLRDSGVTAELLAERETGITCMPSEMHQIFANLVSNAIDAMPHGGRLTVRLRPSLDWRDGETPGMRVTFRDTGMGMNRATVRRSSEPFFTTKMETGTGLGLWVVAQLVERRHGHLRVWSTQRAPGNGTAFSVFLPFVDTLAIAAASYSEPILASPGTP
jgi:PAS domain S-box-containing protein